MSWTKIAEKPIKRLPYEAFIGKPRVPGSPEDIKSQVINAYELCASEGAIEKSDCVFNAVSIGERLGLSKQEAFMMLKGVVPNKMWQAMSYEFEGV